VRGTSSSSSSLRLEGAVRPILESVGPRKGDLYMAGRRMCLRKGCLCWMVCLGSELVSDGNANADADWKVKGEENWNGGIRGK
jgi:hypothetical protein